MLNSYKTSLFDQLSFRLKIIEREVSEIKDILRGLSRRASLNEKDLADVLIPWHDCDVSVRLYNCLKNFGLKHLQDLRNYTEDEIKSIRNFGKNSYEELKRLMLQYDIKFKDE